METLVKLFKYRCEMNNICDNYQDCSVSITYTCVMSGRLHMISIFLSKKSRYPYICAHI